MPSAHPPRNARQVHPGALRDSSGNLLPPSTRCPLEKPLPLLHLLPPCCVRWNKAVLRSKCAGSRHSSPFSGRQSLLGSCPQHYQDRAVGSLSQARPPLCPALPPESPALVPAYLPLSPTRPPSSCGGLPRVRWLCPPGTRAYGPVLTLAWPLEGSAAGTPLVYGEVWLPPDVRSRGLSC